MNTNFNNSFLKLLPFVYAVLLAYIIATVVFIFLPKNGVEYINSSKNDLVYEKYDGFYSKMSVARTTPQKRQAVKKIETLSKYKLKAVYSTTSHGGWAIVEKTGDKNSIILEQNQDLGEYVLIKLYKKYIVFEKDSKEYKLELKQEKAVKYNIETNNKFGKENIVVSDDNIKVKRNYLNSYVNNIEKVWQNIAIEDIREKNQIKGFKVTSVNKSSVFGKLGLKANDIIKSVNGVELKSYADAFKIYNGINKLDFLTLEVERNNEIVELNYEID